MVGFILFLINHLEGKFGNSSGTGRVCSTLRTQAPTESAVRDIKIRFVYRSTQLYIIHPKHARVAGELGEVFNFRTLRKKKDYRASQPPISVSGVEPDSGLSIYIYSLK